MKYNRILLLVAILQLTTNSFAQDVLGKWYAKFTNSGIEEHYLIDIRKGKNLYYGYLDLPAENKFRIKLDTVEYKSASQSVYLSHEGLDFYFKGKIITEKNEIEGKIGKQESLNALSFSRSPQVERSQSIKAPLPYLSQEITFFNRDSTEFSGTLTIPYAGGTFNAVVLITGSGPQDRNEEILGHKPFEVLADYLTRKGTVVLRYDDRGYGKSKGQFRPATSIDYAYDAMAAVEFLQKSNKFKINKLGLIGHSEGGNIAPVVASRNAAVEFLVFLAAPGVSNLESYLVSLDLILKEYPDTYDRDYPFFESVYRNMADINDKDVLQDSLHAKFTRISKLMSEEELLDYSGAENYIKNQTAYHASDWYHHYLQFDVTPYLEKLKLPLLALNGNMDTSVEAKVNLGGIEKTMKDSGNPNYKLVELKDVNHFFQVSKDDKIKSVYFNVETFSNEALLIIGEWLESL